MNTFQQTILREEARVPVFKVEKNKNIEPTMVILC